jgi:uncharacterized protein (TIGR00255 family)
MTGFGAAEGQAEDVRLAVEVRTVNHRYLKPSIRLPEAWAGAETEIERIVRSRLRRGSIALTVRMKLDAARQAYTVNADALGGYIEQLLPLEVEANPTLRIDLGSLMQLPGVCEPPELDELCRRTWDTLSGLVHEALDKVEQMRRREGQALRDDLLGHCDALEQGAREVAERAPEVVELYHQRLRDRVAELTGEGTVQIDAEALAREVAIFAERSDISEEVSRLLSHLEHFRSATGTAGAVGRKLEFIAQEMLREANTIASKAGDAGMARTVVEMKAVIDRIKEQVQNVE